MECVDRLRPVRVVFDSLSEMRLLAQNSLRYRRQILALKQYFSLRKCTVLMLDDRSSDPNDLQLHSIAHGVITLEQAAQEYGTERRRLRVVKMRGVKYRCGYQISSSKRAALRCSRGWSHLSITPIMSKNWFRPAWSAWTKCSVVAYRSAPISCLTVPPG